ncbi:MAG: NUDIX domain-containing protein [Chthoniobacteraceae bacterium]
MQPSILSSSIKYEGRFLQFCHLTVLSASGEESGYECVGRVAEQSAATAVAIVQRDGEPHVVLVKQFRPPMNNITLEFPAGLVDERESPGITAVRELAEETGFDAVIKDVGPFVCNSPGMTNEQTAIVLVSGGEQATPCAEDVGHIKTCVVPLRGLLAYLRQEAANGLNIGAKLWSFALGLSVAESTLRAPADRP